MTTLSRSSSFTAAMIPWLLNLATRLLARLLNMPEPLLYHAGMFVFARVAEVESSVGKTFCPIRLLRRLRNRLGQSAR